jgi:hypothetical protein
VLALFGKRAFVEVAGIEPASFSVSMSLLRVQSLRGLSG